MTHSIKNIENKEMVLAAIAINRPMPLQGFTEKTLCTVICMYTPKLRGNGELENPDNAHYQHLHFDCWEKLCEWLATAKLGSQLKVIH